MIERRFAPKRFLDDEGRERVVQLIADLVRAREEIVFAYVHGSFVKEKAFRDVDVAVYSREPVDPVHYESDLSYELADRTGLPVEVRVINEAPVAFQMAVLRDGRRLVARGEEVLADFIVSVGRRYREHRHFRDLYLDS